MSTLTKAQIQAELDQMKAENAALKASQPETAEAPVELTVEQRALQSDANAYFIVNIGGVEIAVRKDTLTYQRNWDALNMLENLEAAIMNPETVNDVNFDEQPTTYKLCVGKEKADPESTKRIVCGVEVSTARASSGAPARSTGRTFTRTSL